MLHHHRLFSACGSVVLALSVISSASAAKLDLERITPVPATETIPVVDFFRTPFLSGPTINPAGTHVAAVVSAGEDHTKLLMYELATKKVEAVGTRGDSDIYGVTWLNDTKVAYSISIKKFAGFILCAADVTALQNRYPLLQNVGASLVAVPPNDRLRPLVRIGRDTSNSGKYGEVVTVDATVSTGKFLDLSGNDSLLTAQMIDETAATNDRHILERHPIMETPGGFDLYFLADKEGKLAYGVSSTDGVLALHRLVGNKWVKCPEDLDQLDVHGVGDNSSDIVVLAPRSEGKPRPLQFMDAASGKPGEVLFQDAAYDFDGWLYHDPVSRNIVGAVFNRSGPQVIWFTESYRALQKVVDALFPGMVVRILGTDDSGKVILLNTFSDRQPPIYRWVNLEKRTRGEIQNSRPWIDPNRMQPMSVMKYKTRDGHRLDAYVTMPAGASKQNPPPLIVLPHGGGRSTWGFDATVQFFASRGYAVLQPNYRGSSGYGWMFPVDAEWDFRKMHEDVTDATKALIAAGLVDRNRIGIVGTSFGGFLAMEGAAFEPDLYKCAVGVSPVCDWAKTIQDRKYNKFSSAWYSRMLRKLGDPKQDPSKFDAISPFAHAGAIRAAVLIAYGEYDASDVTSVARDLVSVVRKNNVPAETISFVNEADGVNHLGHAVELNERIESFLAQHLAPAVHAAAATATP